MDKNLVPYLDIDNPNYQSDIDPILSHSKIAQIYRYRPPYIKGFFRECSKKLLLNNKMNLLDLCCGRGELSSGFSGYVKHINGIDGSPQMLDHAIVSDNVKYHLADVNNQKIPVAEKIDHILIGSAIHWIKYETLKSIIYDHLKVNGMILVSHPLFKFDRHVNDTLIKLNQDYGRVYDDSSDHSGRSKMSKCDCKEVGSVGVYQNVRVDTNFLYNNQLSYAYGSFYQNTFNVSGEYKKEFFEKISPYAKNGFLYGKLINWALIYAPS